jgi:hypothetical protein
MASIIAKKVCELDFSAPFELLAQATFVARAKNLLQKENFENTIQRIANKAYSLQRGQSRHGMSWRDKLYLGNIWLNLYPENDTNSLLLPAQILSQNDEASTVKSIRVPPLSVCLIESVFPQTLKLLKLCFPPLELSTLLDELAFDTFPAEIKNRITMMPHKEGAFKILHVCSLEEKRWQMNKDVSTLDGTFDTAPTKNEVTRLLNLPDDELFQTKFRTAEQVVLSMDFFKDENKIDIKKSYSIPELLPLMAFYTDDSYMILPKRNSIAEMISITTYQALALNEFRESISMKEASRRIMNFMDNLTIQFKQFILRSEWVTDEFFHTFVEDRLYQVMKDCVAIGALVQTKH